MTNTEIVEILVISKITGSITAEENKALQNILDVCPFARELQDHMMAVLGTPEAHRVIHAPPGKPPFKRRKKKNNWLNLLCSAFKKRL